LGCPFAQFVKLEKVMLAPAGLIHISYPLMLHPVLNAASACAWFCGICLPTRWHSNWHSSNVIVFPDVTADGLHVHWEASQPLVHPKDDVHTVVGLPHPELQTEMPKFPAESEQRQ